MQSKINFIIEKKKNKPIKFRLKTKMLLFNVIFLVLFFFILFFLSFIIIS